MLIAGIIAIIMGVVLNVIGIYGVDEACYVVGIILIIVWFFKGRGKKILNKLLSGQDLNSTLRESAVEKIASHVDENSNPLVSKMLKAQKKFYWKCQICGEEVITMGATQVTAPASSKSRCFGSDKHRWYCVDQEELDLDLQFKETGKASNSTAANSYDRLTDAQLWQVVSKATPQDKARIMPTLIKRGYFRKNAAGKLERTSKSIPKM